MGTNQTIMHSKSEKSSSVVQEGHAVYRYPDWSSMQAYYGPGVPIPASYFSAPVASGHTQPYIWSPQPMPVHFVRPCTAMYHHGLHYPQSPSIHIASGNLDGPAVPSNGKERVLEKPINVLDNFVASIGDSKSKSAGSSGNKSSESGFNGVTASSDGCDWNSESEGSERKSFRCSEVLLNSGFNSADKLTTFANRSSSDATPTISLGMSKIQATVTGKPCTTFRANLTPGMNLPSSSVSELKSGGEQNLPTRTPVEKELKREKRKQSNRESARRSRLRKQAEAEELAVKLGTLTAENTSLRSELTQLTESSDKLRLVNSTLMNKLRTVQVREEGDVDSDRLNYDGAPGIVVENLLSRIDSCVPVCESILTEDEPRDNSIGKLRQLLDLNP